MSRYFHVCLVVIFPWLTNWGDRELWRKRWIHTDSLWNFILDLHIETSAFISGCARRLFTRKRNCKHLTYDAARKCWKLVGCIKTQMKKSRNKCGEEKNNIDWRSEKRDKNLLIGHIPFNYLIRIRRGTGKEGRGKFQWPII